MVARINTVAFQGVNVTDIDVQVQIASGMVAFTVVGLPDKAVAESRERVRAALHAMGLAVPAKRITVNLAPADVVKEGSHYDLPIALALLAAMDVIPAEDLVQYYAMGELSLDGSIRSVNGVLPAAIHASGQDCGLICPADSAQEALWAGDIDLLAPPDLMSLINHIKGTQLLTMPTLDTTPSPHSSLPDLADVKGQETAKRALEITAAGGHNLLMIGPPGSGKSMLAARLSSILPPLTAKEALDVSMIHSLAGELPEGGLVQTRPYRDPHQSSSLVSLVGGGQRVRPGEISLAHNGVLFLDELPEFNRQTLEALRQPLESGKALIARANQHVTYPARFQLIAAMNPCRCGYLDDPEQACTKAPKCALDYQSKISGPMFDRIDLHADVPAVSIADLSEDRPSENSATVAARVQAARAIQANRFAALNSPITINAHADGTLLDQITEMDKEAQSLLKQSAETLKLSARGYHRILRVARTIADLDSGAKIICKNHIAEALSFRRIRPQ